MGGSNTDFLTILKAGKSKIKVLSDLDLDEDPPPGLQMVTFLWYLHIVGRKGERGEERGEGGGKKGEKNGKGEGGTENESRVL